MRGAPPIHLVLLAIAFGLFAIPLAQLTFARHETVMAKTEAPTTPSDQTGVLLRLRFAHVPKSLSLKLGDKELIPSIPLVSPLEIRTAMALPADGMDLLLEASWPEGTPETPVTIDLEPDGLETKSHTRWSTGTGLHESLPFLW
ncbi:hypothetical protein BH11VER1_BH11VER1_30470 [soil metagenome]